MCFQKKLEALVMKFLELFAFVTSPIHHMLIAIIPYEQIIDLGALGSV